MKASTTKLLLLLRRKEFRKLAYLVSERIPYSIFRYNKFYIVFREADQNVVSTRPLGLEYRLMVEDFDYQLLERINLELPQDLGTVWYRSREREDLTKIIYVEHRGTIVAVNFVLFSERIISPSGWEFEMEEVAPMIYGAYIEPRYRLKGLHAQMTKVANDLVKDSQARRLYGEIHYMNTNSLRSYKRLGFHVFKTVTYVQIFGKKFFFMRGSRPLLK